MRTRINVYLKEHLDLRHDFLANIIMVYIFFLTKVGLLYYISLQ